MAILEKQFRNRFVARDGGYVFRQWGHEVVFTRAEYEGFVAERGRLWSDWTFVIYLVLGVAAPVWLWLIRMDAAAWTLAGIALLVMIVVLTRGERLPNGVAETRVRINDPDAPVERYTPEEYDRDLIRQRERLSKPQRWILPMMLPLAGLIAMYVDGHPQMAGAGAAFFLILILFHAIEIYRGPGVAARRRARGEPEPVKGRERSIWDLALSAGFFTLIASANFSDQPPSYFYTRWFFVAFALAYVGELAVRFYRSRAPHTA